VSTFSGLSGALSALYAQRRGMDIVGQNIANANTEGYSRQRVDLDAVGSGSVPAIYSNSDGTSGGVTVRNVVRISDAFLEARGRIEHAQSAYLADQKMVYGRIEQVFNEPTDAGLQSQLSAFWGSWHDLANRPGDAASRVQVTQQARTVVNTLSGAHDRLSSLFTSTREQLDAYAIEINTTANQVAQLNQKIVHARQAELPESELSDRRDQMVLHLSELTGASALAMSDGSMGVLLNGSALVNGSNARAVKAIGAARMDDLGVAPVKLVWSDTEVNAGAPSGQVASTLEALNTTLPTNAGYFDRVAASLATTVNTQHAAGFDLLGNPGGAFFTGSTAADIGVAFTDPNKVAAAASPAAGGGGTHDGSNADALAGLARSETGPDRTYRQVVVDLGIATQTASTRANIQNVITADVDSARLAQSGVNLDEEMASMIAFQHAYQAASRVITAIDEMLDTLINRTGLVGR
jgi:flagellar hook-associated protein 1